MAQPDIVKGTYFVLAKGDGAVSETFTPLCGITTKTFRGQVNTNDQFTRDCADPENLPIRRITATGKQWSLTGNGVLNRENIQLIQESLGEIGNYRFLWTEPADDLVFQGFWEGAFMLTNFEEGASDEAYGTIQISLESDGEVEFTEV
jgi:hypothetical protein